MGKFEEKIRSNQNIIGSRVEVEWVWTQNNLTYFSIGYVVANDKEWLTICDCQVVVNHEMTPHCDHVIRWVDIKEVHILNWCESM